MLVFPRTLNWLYNGCIIGGVLGGVLVAAGAIGLWVNL